MSFCTGNLWSVIYGAEIKCPFLFWPFLATANFHTDECPFLSCQNLNFTHRSHTHTMEKFCTVFARQFYNDWWDFITFSFSQTSFGFVFFVKSAFLFSSFLSTYLLLLFLSPMFVPVYGFLKFLFFFSLPFPYFLYTLFQKLQLRPNFSLCLLSSASYTPRRFTSKSGHNFSSLVTEIQGDPRGGSQGD